MHTNYRRKQPRWRYSGIHLSALDRGACAEAEQRSRRLAREQLAQGNWVVYDERRAILSWNAYYF